MECLVLATQLALCKAHVTSLTRSGDVRRTTSHFVILGRVTLKLNSQMTRRKWMTVAVVLALGTAGLVVACGAPMINDVTTGQTPEYPDLQPQRFDADFDTVFKAAVDTLTSMGIEIKSKDSATGSIQAVATTRIFRFKDDVTITLTRDGGATMVNIRSASRVGKSDLGMNAKRIRRIQASLGDRL